MKVCIFMLNNKKCKLGEKECPGYQNCNKCSAVIDMEQIRKDDEQLLTKHDELPTVYD